MSTAVRTGATSGTSAAWSWVEHLRTGGSTPWVEWHAHWRPVEPPAPVPARHLPGAQQLELLRRFNQDAPVGPVLADRVLRASALGRGLPDMPLLGAHDSPFGPPPVDPARLPVSELLRVATLMLADALAATEPVPPPTPARRHLLRRGYRLVGDAWQADQLRDGLRRRGRPPGGLRPRVFVMAGPVDRMLADAWARRCFTHGAPPWRDWLESRTGRALPRTADVAGAAASWSRRVGPRRITVVTDPALLPRLVGTRGLEPALDLGPDALDLARRVALALEVAAPPARRPGLLFDVLRPALGRHAEPGRLLVPDEHRAWLRRRAGRQRHRVLAAGYAVAGDVDALLPHPGQGAAMLPQEQGVLRLAGRLLVEGPAATSGAGPGAGTGGQRT